MKFNINSFQILIITTIFLIALLIGSFLTLFILVFIITIYLLCNRYIPPKYNEDSPLKEGIFYCPVNGKIKSIQKDVDLEGVGQSLTKINFVTSWWREFGIYLPVRSEVMDLGTNKVKSRFRYSAKSTNISQLKETHFFSVFRCANNDQYAMAWVKCWLGMWPSIKVVPGDRGKAQVNIGFFTLGGTTILYLPQKYEILVQEGLDVVAGQTIIAGQKETNKDVE